MLGCRVTCRSFSSLGRNKCVHPSILPCNNPFRLICSNVACSGSRYPMNRNVCTLFYQALHVDESTGFLRLPLVHTLHRFQKGEGWCTFRGWWRRQTPLFFREKRINKYIYSRTPPTWFTFVPRCTAEKGRYIHIYMHVGRFEWNGCDGLCYRRREGRVEKERQVALDTLLSFCLAVRVRRCCCKL